MTRRQSKEFWTEEVYFGFAQITLDGRILARSLTTGFMDQELF